MFRTDFLPPEGKKSEFMEGRVQTYLKIELKALHAGHFGLQKELPGFILGRGKSPTC